MTDRADQVGNDDRIEAALRESEERFAKAFHTSPVGNVLVRLADRRIVEVNDAFLKTVGYTREELVGAPASIMQYEPRGVLREVTNEAFSAGRGFEGLELRYVRKDGSMRNCLRSNHPISIGAEQYALGTLIDITERKQIEQSLRDSQARLQAALEGSGMGTWIWEVASDQAWWDDAAVRLFGRTPTGNNVFSREQALSFIHPEDQQRVAAALQHFLKTGSSISPEFRSARPDGRVQWLMSRGHAIYADNGEFVRMAGVFIDVTEHRRAEEARTHSQKMEALGTLAGGIAHDFNNILLAITGNARLARADLPAQHPVVTSLVEIEKAGARAADLVRRILVFSRQQEAKHEINALPAIIEDALKLIRPTLPALIEIHSELSAATPTVAAESVQIHQVMMNLLTNAAHAIGDAKGLIEVHLDPVVIDVQIADMVGLQPGRYARLTISDDGSGMDKATVERIFDPFFTTKPPGQGTGLGLPVVHGIVNSHGGAINVYSQPGKGTTFKLYFPAADAVPVTTSTTTAPSTERGNAQHILFVDDEESLTTLAARILPRLGYVCTICTDPRQALEMFRAAPDRFHAVVTDLSMQGMSGFELAAKLRSLRPDLPILMTSGYMRSEDRQRAAQLGIRELIAKPNTAEDLGQALARALYREV